MRFSDFTTERAEGAYQYVVVVTTPFMSLPFALVPRCRVVKEKRATFAAVPGLTRPLNTTPWPTLALAGDWTDTGYPGVLEGAVRSGLQAARVLNPRAD